MSLEQIVILSRLFQSDSVSESLYLVFLIPKLFFPHPIQAIDQTLLFFDKYFLPTKSKIASCPCNLHPSPPPTLHVSDNYWINVFNCLLFAYFYRMLELQSNCKAWFLHIYNLVMFPLNVSRAWQCEEAFPIWRKRDQTRTLNWNNYTSVSSSAWTTKRKCNWVSSEKGIEMKKSWMRKIIG